MLKFYFAASPERRFRDFRSDLLYLIKMQNEVQWLLSEKYGLAEMPAKPSLALKKDLKKLERGLPIAYVIGSIDFLGLRICLSDKTLIPRAETEIWVEKFLSRMPEKKKLSVLDIFSGSGAIGLAVAKSRPRANVVLSELCEGAINQIRKNVRLNSISNTKIIRSDIWKKVGGQFDYIFANPPYVPLARKELVQGSVIKFEPKMAVFGGEDGLLYIRRFLDDLHFHLKPAGVAYMEFDPPEMEEIGKLVEERKLKVKFHKDQFDFWRIAELSRA